jgi:hypothetical protein
VQNLVYWWFTLNGLIPLIELWFGLCILWRLFSRLYPL